MEERIVGGNWRDRAATSFQCEKQPATSSRGMVVSNHPLASSAGAEMLAAGGNAIDAAIATLFTLTVVEPMMVGIIGGGMAHIRLADGSHRFIDGQSTVPQAVKPDTYTSKPGSAHDVFDTVGNENLNGPKAVAVPGSLKAWCETLRRFGTMSLADVMQPAIKHAARGYAATPYLHECITDGAGEMLKDKPISAIYLPDGAPLKPGERVVQAEYAETLKYIADHGDNALYQGPLGDILVDYMKKNGGFIAQADLATYKTVERQPIRCDYRGWEILGPPPPAASGVHITQMLNILEGYDIARLGFGTAETIHYLAEVLKIAFADRAAASGDPAYINVPVERLTSKAYAEERRRAIDPAAAQAWSAGVTQLESAHTTHMTAADAMGNVVATTQTINNLFGAKILIPGLGTVPNNYMNLFDPRPGHALSLAAGKRVTTSMSPMMALRDGRLTYALGLPGGKRIFPSAMQALINLIDHGMSLQEAVEAPRVWTEGNALEVEQAVPEAVRAALSAKGHKVQVVPTVAGGMNAIQFHADGTMSGAACWRADGTPVGIAGGLARAGVRFALR
ncbi:gamma-glutamyltransferase [Bradyrhizobium elkanii]|uniref:gamma-glutamyltransferase n=1 Tax=Bradyrhizobium elkanii TaxID=29448 RepID=UPI0020A0F18C|nr:gamma-glutamyltransferase [Bradyrhizobium elkanii]MCP1974423.1 gamma-glutamyltranspeptidase/glutathione hydrolase [Bradyrhizobium elkanii]MCS3521502.1 gamma-glutamyltranspeptidase/glutathione hydrolase [Bradyrhizobium elkanii]MCS4069157.1 gamma-glutamyltranspeptidase/glutathione hydrolase [Bradyrhizobium elkanii]MCS4084691.1 gamma-glutamyltranspeptidase/glutathione hydrolase [Bradyrhizobium elkanii]MCS4104072.1 gamma-glutamyltranspeptidase/glutathione hydrolase [Bradyrhizobium elkanii]